MSGNERCRLGTSRQKILMTPPAAASAASGTPGRELLLVLSGFDCNGKDRPACPDCAPKSTISNHNQQSAIKKIRNPRSAIRNVC
jgi:hypothetical protein